MKQLLATAFITLMATSAFAQSAAESTGLNSVTGTPPKTEDFVLEAASGDMFEIESSKLAAERAQGNVKAFADQMLADHQKTSDELKQMVTSGKVQATLPTSMTEEHQETLEETAGSSGG